MAQGFGVIGKWDPNPNEKERESIGGRQNVEPLLVPQKSLIHLIWTLTFLDGVWYLNTLSCQIIGGANKRKLQKKCFSAILGALGRLSRPPVNGRGPFERHPYFLAPPRSRFISGSDGHGNKFSAPPLAP